uniref:receptor protein-tyrosine kinase n=1 Tax=Heterorhabditis bacteriophora TaxID=37862 RepID=A0A1I7XLU1_HETBA
MVITVRIRHQAVLKKKERDNDRNTITLEKMAALHHAPYQPLPIEMQNELKNLPHVTQDCIELEKKLGTGSFGEVWEGVASKLPVVGEKQTRVAIKVNPQFPINSVSESFSLLFFLNILYIQLFRWLAPESAMEGLFSSKSDIWAFGVLLFEIISLGQKPYAAMENHQVLSYVKNGGTPSKPPFCPDQLKYKYLGRYKLMQRCWAFESAKRPSFTELLPLFEKLREKIEFQDDKPFPPSGGHCNDAFELSHDSTSSERNETAKDKDLVAACSFGGFDKQYDQSRFDKSSAGSVASVKKQGRPSIIRSLRKEKAKPAPLPSTEDIDARLQYVNSGRPTSSLSNDASTAYYDCGSHFISSYLAKIILFYK